MSPLFQCLLFFWLATTAYSIDCPNRSHPGPNDDDCILAVAKPEFYKDVVRQCFAFGGVPVKIQSAFENAFVYSMSTGFNEVLPYIGVERRNDANWTFSDGSPLSYANWAPSEPNNANVCAVLQLDTLKWASADCMVARPYFCSSNGNGPVTIDTTTSGAPSTRTPSAHCPNGWIYTAETAYCYFLQDFTYDPDGYWVLYNRKTAEAACQRMGTHLVSIHSARESAFVLGLISSNVKNLPNVIRGSGSPCYSQWVWIGYYGTGVVGTGNWTDGSPVDYTYAKVRDVEYWVMSNDYSCGYDEWGVADPEIEMARYVCKMAPNSQLTKVEA